MGTHVSVWNVPVHFLLQMLVRKHAHKTKAIALVFAPTTIALLALWLNCRRSKIAMELDCCWISIGDILRIVLEKRIHLCPDDVIDIDVYHEPNGIQ